MLDAVDTYAEVVVNSEQMFDMDYDIAEYGTDRKKGSRSFAQAGAGAGPQGAASDSILDIREYDIPYYLRVAIDKRQWRDLTGKRCGELNLTLYRHPCRTLVRRVG